MTGKERGLGKESMSILYKRGAVVINCAGTYSTYACTTIAYLSNPNNGRNGPFLRSLFEL